MEKADEEDIEEQTRKIYSEVNLMRLLNHQNIIQFNHIEEDDEFFYVVMELVTGNFCYSFFLSFSSLSPFFSFLSLFPFFL